MASGTKANENSNDDSMYVYDMSHKNRGKCLIINNVNFIGNPDPRKGSDQDAADVKAVFDLLGFDSKIQRDQTAEQMKTLVESLAADDHRDSDCVAVFILSHGKDGGVIDGIDEPLKLDDIFTPFKHSNTLVGKPKLFFIQACRGRELDEGVKVLKDADSGSSSSNSVFRIPQQADFFYAYSTPPGHFSMRRSTGSWFIQAIKKVFTQNRDGTKLEIQQLMTRVHREVAYEYESNFSCKNCTTSSKCLKCLEFSEKKQVSSHVSMLTKDLYFKPKQ